MIAVNTRKMTERERNKLFQVIDRFIFHSNYQSDNPATQEMARKMRDIDLFEMWMLTQM